MACNTPHLSHGVELVDKPRKLKASPKHAHYGGLTLLINGYPLLYRQEVYEVLLANCAVAGAAASIGIRYDFCSFAIDLVTEARGLSFNFQRMRSPILG